MQGWGFVNLPSLLYYPYLVRILFGMPSLHPFTFLMFFKSCQLLTSSSLQPKRLAIWNPLSFHLPSPCLIPKCKEPAPGTMLPLCAHMVQYWPRTDHRRIPFHEFKVQKWGQPPQNYSNAAVKTPLENLWSQLLYSCNRTVQNFSSRDCTVWNLD